MGVGKLGDLECRALDARKYKFSFFVFFSLSDILNKEQLGFRTDCRLFKADLIERWPAKTAYLIRY
jgi:hypothetical protein